MRSSARREAGPETRTHGEAAPDMRREAAQRVVRPRDEALGIALLLLGGGAAAVALLGPLALGVLRYHVSAGAVDQVAGGDAAGLVLVAPAALAAGWLVLTGRRLGAILALGPAGYGLYMYSQLALGGDVLRYPGNSERFFLLFVGLFVLAGFALQRAWAYVDHADLPTWPRWLARWVAVFALAVGAFLALGLHLPGLLDAWRAQPTSREMLADPALFWLVKLMDLAIVVPVLIAVGVSLLRRRASPGKATYAVVGWMALLGSSVAGMAIVMQARSAPGASWVNTVAFTAFAAVGLVIAVLAYLPLRPASPRRGRPPVRGDRRSEESA